LKSFIFGTLNDNEMRYFSEIKLIGRASILFLEIRIRVGALECKHTYRSFLRDVSSVAYA